jgi:hypothetical protein
MTTRMQLDTQDRRALRALDDTFTVSSDGTTVTTATEVEVVRFTSDGVDQFRLRFKFPSEELLDVKIRRSPLLEQLEIEANES